MTIYSDGAIHTYNASGNREDISDVMDMIDPTDTPYYTMARKTKATATNHQWLYDSLQAAATGGLIEGTDATYVSGVQPTFQNNPTQIFRRSFAVTKTEESVLVAGRKSEYRRKLKNAILELKRDHEKTIFMGSGATAAGNSATARHMKNIMAFVTQSGGLTATITVNALNLGLEEIWTAGAKPEFMITAGKVKGFISKLTYPNLNRNVRAKKHEAVLAVDIFDSDYGVVEISADRFINTGQILAGQKSLCRYSQLRKPFVQHLPDLGGGPRGMTEAEGCVEPGHPNGFSKWTGITA